VDHSRSEEHGELNKRDLGVNIRSSGATWKMVRSSDHDMLVGLGGDRFWLSFAAAGSMRIEPYETGFKSGIRITLGGFRGTGQIAPGAPLDVRVVLTLCQEGADEDLVAEAMVNEGAAAVKELHWPRAMDGREVDYTVLSNLARGGRRQHYPEPSDRKLVDVQVGL
jgi:hypothetical protein